MGLTLFGIFYIIKYIANRFLLIEKLDKNELSKEEERTKNWELLKVYAVAGTPYYSIVQTEEDYYFLVKHDSLGKILSRKATWSAYQLKQMDAEKVINRNAQDQSLISLGGFSAVLIFLSNTFMDVTNWWWFLDLKNVLYVLFSIILGIVVGLFRVKRNIKIFEEESSLFTKLGQAVEIQIMGKQRWMIFVPLTGYLILIMAPLTVWVKMIFWGALFSEIIPRMFSSIAISKRRKDPNEVTRIQKYLYGDEAFWIDLGSSAEINKAYKEQL